MSKRFPTLQEAIENLPREKFVSDVAAAERERQEILKRFPIDLGDRLKTGQS